MTRKTRRYITTLPAGQPRVGPEPNGVTRCLRCLKPIRPRERWLRYDRRFGACAVGIHERCRRGTVTESLPPADLLPIMATSWAEVGRLD